MTSQEYNRVDWFDPAGIHGVEVDLRIPPTRVQKYLDVVIPVANRHAAECGGEPRLDIIALRAWAEWKATIPTDPPRPDVTVVRTLIRTASYAQWVRPQSDTANQSFGFSFNPPVQGPFGPYAVQLVEQGVTPPLSQPNFGFTADPGTPVPIPRYREQPCRDFALQFAAGFRRVDLPPPPGLPQQRLRIYWEAYVRIGWYFAYPGERPKDCCEPFGDMVYPLTNCEGGGVS